MTDFNKKPPQEESLDGFIDLSISHIPVEINDRELLDIFPEAKEIIPQKIMEYKKERSKIVSTIKKHRAYIKTIAQKNNRDDFYIWFNAYAIPKYLLTPYIINVDRHLYRLYRQKRLLNKNNNTRIDSIDWYELKETAKNKPLIDEVLPHLEKVRQVGSRVTALCPFHKEKTPSFVIYLNENNCHCFGCGFHADVIGFKMKIDNISFKEAVKELAL